MKKSNKIIRNSILTGILGGVLFTIVVLYLGIRGSNAIRWSKLPSPPEQIIAIQYLNDPGYSILESKNGNFYSCAKGASACELFEGPQEYINQLPTCTQKIIDQDIPEPSSQSGRVIDACNEIYYEEYGEVTLSLLLYEDNNLWLGVSGGPGFLPMYGAEYFVVMIFCMGSFVCFFLGWGFFLLQAKFRQRSTIPMQTD